MFWKGKSLVNIPLITSLGFKVLITGIIAILTALSMFINLSQVNRHMIDRSLHEARGVFSLMLLAREWNSFHAGVYVEVTDEVKPNPYLKDPNRDLFVNGKQYTKMNPAFMTREIAQLTKQKKGTVVHITSLTPLNPSNKADPWERAALQQFNQGSKEYYQFITSSQKSEFRYAAPLELEESCLNCHNEPGNKIGQVRGAISITLPGKPLVMMLAPQKRNILISHSVVFLTIAVLIWLFLSSLKRNLQERKEYEKQMEYQAFHDSLTGLPNRRRFVEIFSSSTKEKGNFARMSVMFLDLDGFKDVNDTFGHPVGDELLRETAARLTGTLGRGDVAARLGGDEFLVLVRSVMKQQEVTAVAEKILSVISQPFIIQGHTILITASIGISFYPSDGEDSIILLQKADKALYRSKELGRNRWTLFSKVDTI